MSSQAKIVLTASVLAVCLLGPAMAADLTTPAYTDPPAFQWSGAYVGVHGGTAFTKMPNPFAGRNGWSGGVQAGYNIQTGPAVFGAEIEGSYLGGAEHDVQGGRIKEKWRGAAKAKAKAGMSFDQTLLFGTGGVALTKFDKSDGVTSSDGWKGGYLVGAGIEQGFAGGLSAKVEYDYVRTPDVETTSALGKSKETIGSHELKAGINYRF
ncbi:MAG: porin family protein [Mesorhizobium sp.]|nr:porin family protein [bacterium M00.F.Ca.ET.205.01.1.1]TGU48314.1 porin family protein [bacterium M00.F.Ca.ET.152.01.1.1]TGV32574.1 porin family protein [Mesorhizobium sp. M00.F.Ca.ET.186.01.1.1]TGZ39831.1 porin family protein [bacterium M00.F.Ca.ET.162.01.1.1]TIW60497.1 MAG: porin family protein [Mesorhizobium sp.]